MIGFCFFYPWSREISYAIGGEYSEMQILRKRYPRTSKHACAATRVNALHRCLLAYNRIAIAKEARTNSIIIPSENL